MRSWPIAIARPPFALSDGFTRRYPAKYGSKRPFATRYFRFRHSGARHRDRVAGRHAKVTQARQVAPPAPACAAVTRSGGSGNRGITSSIPCEVAGIPTTCQVTVTSFTVVNGVLTAVGTVTGGTPSVTVPFSAPVQATGTCQVLDLTLGALNLDLLGLVVDLNQVHLTITEQQGRGNLIGNLLCAVAGLLDQQGWRESDRSAADCQPADPDPRPTVERAHRTSPGLAWDRATFLGATDGDETADANQRGPEPPRTDSSVLVVVGPYHASASVQPPLPSTLKERYEATGSAGTAMSNRPSLFPATGARRVGRVRGGGVVV